MIDWDISAIPPATRREVLTQRLATFQAQAYAAYAEADALLHQQVPDRERGGIDAALTVCHGQYENAMRCVRRTEELLAELNMSKDG